MEWTLIDSFALTPYALFSSALRISLLSHGFTCDVPSGLLFWIGASCVFLLKGLGWKKRKL